MTTHDKFRAELARSQVMLKQGAITAIVGLVLMLSVPPLLSEDPSQMNWPLFLLMGLSAYGFAKWVYSVLRLRNVIVCPSCGKPLNYLILDPSYSKTAVQFGIPKDLPSNITACPYCHTDLGK